MLNVFPIQFLAPLAYALVRICIGCILIHLGYTHIRHRQSLKEIFSFKLFPYGLFFVWYMGVFEIFIGILFTIGFLTQIASLLTIFLALKLLIIHKHCMHPLIPQRLFYILLLTTALSLFITGAGIFAFDLPI